jgi:catechol 2,3-dioxygenase-like lactoylglutathione lyase family enzyme
MLDDKTATATVAVTDLPRARTFYEDTLGLKPIGGPEPGALVYGNASSALFVYQSRFAGTNQATAVTWSVGADLDAVVRALKAKGVAFEHYDLPETTRDGDIHVAGKTRIAWFKDPDGNIHSLVNR